MDPHQALIDLERQFWTAGPAFYQNHLADEAMLVFPEPAGVLDRQQTIDAIAAAPRWAELRMQAVRLMNPADDVAILNYSAAARRAGETAEYRALVSSVYIRRDGAWKLVFHQHTPGGG